MPTGLIFDVIYNPTLVRLVVMSELLGDYNLNGIVDAADGEKGEPRVETIARTAARVAQNDRVVDGCALGTANGYKVKTEPDAFKVVDGKLYLNYNRKVLELWTQDQADYITRANKNWPEVSRQPMKE